MFPVTNNHMSTIYTCETCGKAFAYKQAYDKHVLYHDYEKITGVTVPNAMSSCGVDGASYQQDMNVNVKIEQDIGASHCEQAVVSQQQYQPVQQKSVQKSTNSGPKARKSVEPYSSYRAMKLHPCDECDKSYTRKDHLTRHKLWHIGDKPHICSVCFKAFIRKDKLQRHERIHYKDSKFDCNICGKYFLRKDGLNKHFASVHEGRGMYMSHSQLGRGSELSGSKQSVSVVNATTNTTGETTPGEVQNHAEQPNSTVLTSVSNVVFPTIHQHNVQSHSAAAPMTL